MPFCVGSWATRDLSRDQSRELSDRSSNLGNLIPRMICTGAVFLAGLGFQTEAEANHQVRRLDVRDRGRFDNRVITFGDLRAAGEDIGPRSSINGPSMVYVPPETPNRLAKYYLYFADHGGDHIRMAYADAPTGPFTLYRPNRGVMSLQGANTFPVGSDRVRRLSSTVGVGHHIASPDVTRGRGGGRFNMLYHGHRYTREGGRWRKGGQFTFAAFSRTGLDFNQGQYGSTLGGPYLREFSYNGEKYGMLGNGTQRRPQDRERPYASGAWTKVAYNRDLEDSLERRTGRDVNQRHGAIKVEGNRMSWWYTAKGEAPERIYEASVRLEPDWTRWEVLGVREVLRPRYDYEGANRPLVPSRSGRPKVGNGDISTAQVNELRDPAYFKDPESGREFLYYSVAGEYGIAVAELRPRSSSSTILSYRFEGSRRASSVASRLTATTMTANGNSRFEDGGLRIDSADPQLFEFRIDVQPGHRLELSGFSLRMRGDKPRHRGQVTINGAPFGPSFSNGSVADAFVVVENEVNAPLTGLTGRVFVRVEVDPPAPFRDTVLDDIQLRGNVTRR